MLQTIGFDDDLQTMADDLAVAQVRVDRLRLEGSLLEFVRDGWHVVETSRPLIENWHIHELCDVLERVTFGDPDYERVIVNIPPGTLKSLIISVFWPAWVWARTGKKRFLAASYGQHLSIRDNLRVRSLIESEWFQGFWPLKLVEDQNTKTKFITSVGGWRIATSVSGPGTGEHPHYIIIDDPHTAQQATSPAERQAAIDWFDQTISSRGSTSGVRIVLVMQRLHQEDLAGHLLAKGGWHHVCFPMRYEKCTCPTDDPETLPEDQRCIGHKADPKWAPDPRDPRTEQGELLCPQVIDDKKVKQLENDLGEYGTAGQLQQRPAPEGGGLFKREWFKFLDVRPALCRWTRGWDTAGSEGKGDYTVGSLVGEEFEWTLVDRKKQLLSTGRIVVADVQRDQLGPDGVDKLMKVTATLDGKTIPIREEQEGGASGKAGVTSRAQRLVGWDYKAVSLGANKQVRAKPFRAQCEAGNVYLVRGDWNEEFIQELSNFPTGKHDDQVDATSCAFNSMILEPPPRKREATW